MPDFRRATRGWQAGGGDHITAMTEATEAALFEAVIVPHRSLSRRALNGLILAIAVLCCINASIFIHLGAWPVGGFTGVELLLAAFLFRLNAHAARGSEMVLLSPAGLRDRTHHPQGAAARNGCSRRRGSRCRCARRPGGCRPCCWSRTGCGKKSRARSARKTSASLAPRTGRCAAPLAQPGVRQRATTRVARNGWCSLGGGARQPEMLRRWAGRPVST